MPPKLLKPAENDGIIAVSELPPAKPAPIPAPAPARAAPAVSIAPLPKFLMVPLPKPSSVSGLKSLSVLASALGL